MESVRHKLVNVWIEANYCTSSLLTWVVEVVEKVVANGSAS
jgi:hypothetical protein